MCIFYRDLSRHTSFIKDNFTLARSNNKLLGYQVDNRAALTVIIQLLS